MRAELAEPEAELVDEVEREPVAARAAAVRERELDVDLVARRDRAAEVDAQAVPDDRVAELVEPVVGEREPIAAPRRCRPAFCSSTATDPHLRAARAARGRPS